MKIFIGFVMLFSLTTAEPPPSHSYLPPSPSDSRNGYPDNHSGHNSDAAPEILASHGIGTNGDYDHHHRHGANSPLGPSNGHDFQNTHDALDSIHSNEFTRTAAHHSNGNYPTSDNHNNHGDDGHHSDAFRKNLLDDTNEPVKYNFGYMVNDYQEGTDFGHHEERLEERAQGGYHVVLPDGRKQTVTYKADERGFNPQVAYEQSDEAGYGSNASNLPTNGHHANGDGAHHTDGPNGEYGHHSGANPSGY